MRKLILMTLLSFCGGVFAHVKPYSHHHIGFLHPEEILALALLIAGGVVLGYRLAKG